LPQLFELQQDSESNRMAYLHPRSREEFDAHWASSFNDPKVLAFAIEIDGSLVGSITCSDDEGRQFVGYWTDKRYWGRGITTTALQLLLERVTTRPLFARVAVSNIASIRVLEKCGFREDYREWSHETRRYVACEEVILKLPATGKISLVGDIPKVLSEELIEVLAENSNVRIERIVSTGQKSPAGFWYDQDETEWVVVLQGAARLRFEHGEVINLQPGDYVEIPSHQRHRVDWTMEGEPTVWLAIFAK
jgi:cupin 2 domain-containing protein